MYTCNSTAEPPSRRAAEPPSRRAAEATEPLQNYGFKNGPV